MRQYILKDKKVVPVEDIRDWAAWFEVAGRHVGNEQIGDSRVSTVFLGIDHSFSESGYPVLWETMVFGGKLDQEQDRCSGGWEQAEAMHAEMVKKVKIAQGPVWKQKLKSFFSAVYKFICNIGD